MITDVTDPSHQVRTRGGARSRSESRQFTPIGQRLAKLSGCYVIYVIYVKCSDVGGPSVASDSGRAFRPRARLIRHLGEDLIPTDRVALTELVKNSYDADATKVIVRFIDTETSHGYIDVWDDGHGMSEKAVLSNWLEIANPNRAQSTRSASGRRRVLGAKGLGRFAAAKVGTRTLLATRPPGGEETTLLIDWSIFADEAAFLDEIQVDWETGRPQFFVGATKSEEVSFPPPHGTLLRLEGLQHAWGSDDVMELRVALSKLLPPPPPKELPSAARPDFEIVIEAPGLSANLSGPVAASETLQHPRYRLFGEVGVDGRTGLTLTVEGRTARESILMSIPDSAALTGPLIVDLRVWDLETPKLRELVSIDVSAKNTHDVRRMIRSNSGVSLYRDNFRVQPYGDPEFDWLNLDGRRVNNPTMRLSNNQMSGSIYITGDDNPDLRDQSNRLGLIENQSYEALRNILLLIIAELERRRYKIRRGEDTPADTHEKSRNLFAAFDLGRLKEIAQTDSRPEVRTAIREAQSDLDAGVDQIQQVLARSSRLATLGSLVDVILHEGRTSLTRMGHEMARAHRQSKGMDCVPVQTVKTNLERVELQVDALDKLFDRIEPLSGRKRGRPKDVSMRSILQKASDVLENEAMAKELDITIHGGEFSVTVDELDILQVLVNLLLNAIYWTSKEHPEGGGAIELIAIQSAGSVEVSVSDNGPGVDIEEADSVFDPYFSTREGGMGLGLAIATSIVQDFYDGSLAMTSPGALGGATFTFSLRRRV